MRKFINLTLESIELDGHTIALLGCPEIISKTNPGWLYRYFILPKKEAFVKERVKAAGYDHFALADSLYYFYHEGKSRYDETSFKVGNTSLFAQMPRQPYYTHYISIDLKARGLNEELKSRIDDLVLDQLETKIKEEGPRPRGVIIALTNYYWVSIRDRGTVLINDS